MKRRTFYTVKYTVLGRDLPEIACFDNRENAYAFYARENCVDKPVAHCISKAGKIEQFMKAVRYTEYTINCNL